MTCRSEAAGLIGRLRDVIGVRWFGGSVISGVSVEPKCDYIACSRCVHAAEHQDEMRAVIMG